jgi:aromatic O-demethylase, cytochrome P450 subunit
MKLPKSVVVQRNPVRSAFDIVADLPLQSLEHDPYQFYGWMRAESPIVYVPETGRVLVTTWDLCKEAGANDAVFGPTKQAHEIVYGRPNVMSMTGDGHRALRNAARVPVQPKAVNGYYETGIRETVVRYIDAIRPLGAADATLEIFEPISQRIVGDVLGFTDVDDGTLSRWFHVYADYLVDYGRDQQVAERVQDVKAEVWEYLEARIPGLLERPGHSGLDYLLRHGMPPGELRSIADIAPTVGVLIVGGFQEPAHLISNTLLGLFGRPDQAQQVASDPAAWARKAIEEGLRWLPPFGFTEKLTTEDVVLGGVPIPADTEIALVIGSANRDPERFADPETFDIDRKDQGNLSFGFGSHFCIGHIVTRAIGEVVIEEIFRRLPNLRLDPNRAPVVHGWLTRAAKSLPLVWDI